MKIGRIRRSTYFIISITIIVINFLIFKDITTIDYLKDLKIYLSLLILIVFILNAGRLNDINLSGWFALLWFIPIVNIGLIALYFIDGTIGKNKYGKDPKGRINEKKITKNQESGITEQKYSKTILTIDNNLNLLQESYNDGLLDEKEFADKKYVIQNEKQILIDNIETEKTLNEKSEKLKRLLENKIITQAEYDKKLKDLYLTYGFDDIVNTKIDLETKLFYISHAQEFGPFTAKRIVRLLNTKEINPNCLIRVENENNYSKRAYEISEMFE